MKPVKNDIINIGLVLTSLLLSILLPFKMFLWSYAILGPLHYITEINWLHKKKYFVQEKKFIWILVIIAFLLSVPIIVNTLLTVPKQTPVFNIILYYLWSKSNLLVLIGFSIAVVLTNKKSLNKVITYSLIAIGLSILIIKYNLLNKIGVLLPSIIHVYFFTILFMLYGAIKSKSKWGVFNVILVCLIPFIIYIIPLNYFNLVVQAETVKLFNDSGFTVLTKTISNILNIKHSEQSHFLNTIIELKIQIFISFAYTYHYLNWFSKTTTIGWHNSFIKKDGSIYWIKWILLLLFWSTTSILYFYNYKMALLFLLVLSYLHVLLEFPLNYITIKEIGSYLKSKLVNK